MKLKVYSSNGQYLKEEDISFIPCFDNDKGKQALLDVIQAIQSNIRQGNACTKTRSQVSGTGKKPWRQKGTGRARHGSLRSPIWRTGGVAHGPKPRDYSIKVNKKIKSLAAQRAIFDSASEGSLLLIEEFKVSAPKTKVIHEFITNISPKGSVLMIDEYFKDDIKLATRNHPRAFMVDVSSLNAWDIVRHDYILLTKQSLEKFIQRIKI